MRSLAEPGGSVSTGGAVGAVSGHSSVSAPSFDAVVSPCGPHGVEAVG